MANIYKSITYRLSTTDVTTVYTTPSVDYTLIRSIYCANIVTDPVLIDLIIQKNTQSDIYIVYGVSIPQNSTFQPITEPIILQQGDVLKAKSHTSSGIDITLSLVEHTI